MKKAVVLLAILSVALAAALWLNRQNAGNQIHRAEAEISSLSNHLAEAEMKLNHQERMNLSLGSNLTNRTAELAKSAGDLAKVRTSLGQSQAETRAIQAQLQSAHSQVQSVQSQLTDLSNRIEELTVEGRHKDTEVALAQAQLAGVEDRLQALAHQLGALQRQNDRMARQLRDPELLRAQIAALKNSKLRLPNQSERPAAGLITGRTSNSCRTAMCNSFRRRSPNLRHPAIPRSGRNSNPRSETVAGNTHEFSLNPAVNAKAQRGKAAAKATPSPPPAATVREHGGSDGGEGWERRRVCLDAMEVPLSSVLPTPSSCGEEKKRRAKSSQDATMLGHSTAKKQRRKGKTNPSSGTLIFHSPNG